MESKEIIRKIRDKADRAEKLEETELGTTNKTFKTSDDKVIKIEEDEDIQHSLSREISVLKLLNKQGFSVPEVLGSGRIDRSRYVILNFIEGKNLSRYSDGKSFYQLEAEEKERKAEMMGRKLAELHSLTVFDRFGLISGESPEPRKAEWSEGLEEMQEWWFSNLKQEGFTDIVKESRNTIEKHSDELNSLDHGSLLHTEFDLRNMVFTENDLYILDWELASFGDPLLDLIMTEKRLFWRQKDYEAKEAFRRGYRDVREIKTEDKIADLYELIVMTRLLLIHNSDVEMVERIEKRIEELFRYLT